MATTVHVETVEFHDHSCAAPPATAASTSSSSSTNIHKPRANEQKKLDEEDDDGFADSRGTRSSRGKLLSSFTSHPLDNKNPIFKYPLLHSHQAKTEDGLLIYSATEMNIGKGGDTEDCPFDCWCCF